MSNPEGQRAGWEEFGRVAEDFARRVADDAVRFARNIEQHAGQFARDVARDWSGAWQAAGRAGDVRQVLSDVFTRVDEVIGALFTDTSGGWMRVVANRDATCTGCGTMIAAGAGAHVRRTAAGARFRCLACGPDAS
jgi:hypothetical protein